VEWEKAADKARAKVDKVAVDKVAVARVVPLRLVLSAPACVRNADRRNHTNAACPALSANARSVEP